MTNLTTIKREHPTDYVASPYTHPDPITRLKRFHEACKATSWLIRQGRVPYSPIIVGHAICTHGGHGVGHKWENWECIDRAFLEVCDRLLILTIPGWKESKGIWREVAIARIMGKPIARLEPAAITMEPAEKRLVDGEYVVVWAADIQGQRRAA